MNFKKLLSKRVWVIGMLSMSAPVANACGPENYTGSVCVVAASFCPKGTLEAAGQILSIPKEQALFSLLGTTYGGDGIRTFGLPNLQGRAPVGRNPAPGSTAPPNTQRVDYGEAVGSAATTLTVNQMPAHTHSFNTAGIQLQASTALGASPAPSATNKYISATFTNAGDGGGGAATVQSWSNTLVNPVAVGGFSQPASVKDPIIGSTGGSQPVQTQSPSLGMLYCIVTGGIFPSRP